jgi:hypothetical protein
MFIRRLAVRREQPEAADRMATKMPKIMRVYGMWRSPLENEQPHRISDAGVFEDEAGVTGYNTTSSSRVCKENRDDMSRRTRLYGFRNPLAGSIHEWARSDYTIRG